VRIKGREIALCLLALAAGSRMTLHQALSLGIVAAMLLLFVSDRIRYDIVAALALCAAALSGVVPPAKAFEGFANPVIIIIASVLVMSRAIAASGVIETSMRRLMQRLRTTTLQVGALTAAVTFLSAVIKNVGTLGIFIPIAVQAAERSGRPPSRYLMPLAFGSLVGGTMTQIGTSPNLLISLVRQDAIGQPYRLFDYAAVGLPLSVLTVLFLSFGWRLIPEGRKGSAAPERRFAIEDYTTEALLPETSPLVGKTVADLEALADGDASVNAIIREHDRRYIPGGHWTLFKDDVLVLQGDPVTLKSVVDQARLKLLAAKEIAALAPRGKHEELETVEAVVTADSPLIGSTPEQLRLRQVYEVNLLAVSRGGRRTLARLRHADFRTGDVVALQGHSGQMAEILSRIGCLPLAERNLMLGRSQTRLLPVVILAGAMALVAMGALPVQMGFFLAAVLAVLFRTISPRQAYEAIEWPIIVMLACLIPVGEAVRETGAAGLIADWLSLAAAHLSGGMAVGLMLLVSMLVTPLMHHAPAVLVMGPIAAAVANNLGYGPDPFLMAVALGASCDFLTPIGHQNNLLVMGPGGYRFGDYWRLGLPLTIMVAVCGTRLIIMAWPLQ
jgi:di/tricarboxylate transporter